MAAMSPWMRTVLLLGLTLLLLQRRLLLLLRMQLLLLLLLLAMAAQMKAFTCSHCLGAR